jgi:hypothetical protein
MRDCHDKQAVVEIGPMSPRKADVYSQMSIANLILENFDVVKSVVPNVRTLILASSVSI